MQLKFIYRNFKILLAAALWLGLAFSSGAAALAAPSSSGSDTSGLDALSSANLTDFIGAGDSILWAKTNAAAAAAISDNALRLDYRSEGQFSAGGTFNANSCKYLVVRIKGAVGGEGGDFDLDYMAGGKVKNTGKAFADLIAPSGGKVPAVTKQYQDIYIDLAANHIAGAIQSIYLDFHAGASGTLWISKIWFTNSAAAGSGTAGAGSAGTSGAGKATSGASAAAGAASAGGTSSASAGATGAVSAGGTASISAGASGAASGGGTAKSTLGSSAESTSAGGTSASTSGASGATGTSSAIANPKTGDGSHIRFYLALSALSAMGLAAWALRRTIAGRRV